MTDAPRLSIDWDGDGAFAVITRPGAPAEVVRLPDIHRVATEAMQAELALRGRVVVRPARWPDHSPGVGKLVMDEDPLVVDEGPPHFIGALGE